MSFPVLHSGGFAFNGTTLGFLRTEAQGAQYQPDIGQTKLDPVALLDLYAHALEGPQFSLKPILGGFAQQGASQIFQRRVIKSGWTLGRVHGTQSINTTIIKHRLPCVDGLPCDTDRAGDIRRFLPFFEQPSGENALSSYLVQSLLKHDRHLQKVQRRLNARALQLVVTGY